MSGTGQAHCRDCRGVGPGSGLIRPLFAPPRQLLLPVELSREPTLDTYLPGPNGEALAAVSALVEGEGDAFIYLLGPTGAGKTHLLQGACLAAARHGRRAYYCPLGQPDLDPAVLDDLEGLDLVALDDLELVAGRGHWEHAIFVLFNRLRENGRALLVAASMAPDDTGISLPDLRSRLHWGPRYQLRGLSDDDCELLLAKTARRRGLTLGPGMVRFMLERYPRDPASLLNLLERVDSLSLREQHRITVPLIKRAMGGEA